LEDFTDPMAPIRIQLYNNAVRALQQFGQPYETITSPNFVPSQQNVDDVQQILQEVQENIANAIANGHGFDEHGENFSSRTAYESAIISTLENNTENAPLSEGRSYYYNASTNFVVIVDPMHSDFGAAFNPNPGFMSTLRK
jgi:hypothetical protein